MMRVEKVLFTSLSNEWMALKEVRSPDVLGYLHTLLTKMPALQACMVESVENGFSAFCRRIAASLSDLTAARQQDSVVL